MLADCAGLCERAQLNAWRTRAVRQRFVAAVLTLGGNEDCLE
jgi:hypothetical protein